MQFPIRLPSPSSSLFAPRDPLSLSLCALVWSERESITSPRGRERSRGYLIVEFWRWKWGSRDVLPYASLQPSFFWSSTSTCSLLPMLNLQPRRLLPQAMVSHSSSFHFLHFSFHLNAQWSAIFFMIWGRTLSTEPAFINRRHDSFCGWSSKLGWNPNNALLAHRSFSPEHIEHLLDSKRMEPFFFTKKIAGGKHRRVILWILMDYNLCIGLISRGGGRHIDRPRNCVCADAGGPRAHISHPLN